MNDDIKQTPAPGIPAQPGIDTVAILLLSAEELLGRSARQGDAPAATMDTQCHICERPLPYTIPHGWRIERHADGGIAVQKVGLGGYAAREDDENIASSIVHALASDMLTAQPVQQPAPVAMPAASQGSMVIGFPDPEAVFAQFCEIEGYPSDGDMDEALRKAFYEGTKLGHPAPSILPDSGRDAALVLPELESLADIPYAKNTPDEWDEDYRSIWQQLQVATRNLTKWAMFGKSYRALAAHSANVAQTATEQRQRERMNRRFADRKPSPATADFDLPAPNDAANVAQVGKLSDAGITTSVLEQAAQACDQQADGTNGPYRSACLACANAVRGLRDVAAKKGPTT